MPNKKKTVKNAFYWYMQDLMPELQRQGHTFPNGMMDVVQIAHPMWKDLPEHEKEKYKVIAKHKKQPMKIDLGENDRRLDNQGNVIALREKEDEVDQSQRSRDRQYAVKQWPTAENKEDILTYTFYFVAFEYLCELEDKTYLPCEIGIVEYTLKDGIRRNYHRFIEPGGIPMGYRFACQNHSEETHQIPIQNFDQADDNYASIWSQILNFVGQDLSTADYPPLYCLCGGDKKTWNVTKLCTRWLHINARTGRPNPLEVFALEDMVQDLYEVYTTERVSVSSLQDMLTTSSFDYEAGTRCKYHEQLGVKHCALGTAQRYAYAISDALSTMFEFEITPRHLPIRDTSQPSYTVISPRAISMHPGSSGKSRHPRSGRGSSSTAGSEYGGTATPTQSSYNALRDGDFPSYDYRLKAQSEADGSEFDGASSTRSSPWASLPQDHSSKPAAVGPWAKTLAADRQMPTIGSEDDFPALGANPIQQRLPKTMSMTAQAALAPKSDSPMGGFQQGPDPVAAAPSWNPAGRGVRPANPGRNINVSSFQPAVGLGRGSAGSQRPPMIANGSAGLGNAALGRGRGVKTEPGRVAPPPGFGRGMSSRASSTQ